MCFAFSYLHLSVQLSMFHMERHSRNTLIIIIIPSTYQSWLESKTIKHKQLTGVTYTFTQGQCPLPSIYWSLFPTVRHLQECQQTVVPKPEMFSLPCYCIFGPVVRQTRRQEPQTWVQFLLSPWLCFQVESYQWLQIGTLAATLPGIWCYMFNTETGWPSVSGWDRKFDLQLLSQCWSMYKCLNRSIPEVH